MTEDQTCIVEPPHSPGDLSDTCARCLYLNSYRWVPADAVNAENYEVYAEPRDAARCVHDAASSGALEWGDPVLFYRVSETKPMWRMAAWDPDGVLAQELSELDGKVLDTTVYPS